MAEPHVGDGAGAPRTRPVQVLAVTSGKGGVGKSVVCANLALALGQLGRRVTLLDADLGLANLGVMLGLEAPRSLCEVLRGERRLNEVVMDGPSGLRVIPGACTVNETARLGPVDYAALVRAFSELGSDLDVLLVDTAAGIAEDVLSFVRAAQGVLLVVCDEPTSINDSYALIRSLVAARGHSRFHVIVNMTRSPRQARRVFMELSRRAYAELDVNLDYLGAVPFDPALRRAIQNRRPVLDAHPRSPSARAFRDLARRTDALPVPDVASGQIEFFFEQLIGVGAPAEGAQP